MSSGNTIGDTLPTTFKTFQLSTHSKLSKPVTFLLKNKKVLIYLIGFMGSGKTTVGKKLSKELGYLFIDLDSYLERKYQASIPQLFENKGEAEFRKLEKQCLSELSNLDGVVISTGGGTPCFFDNMTLMKSTGFTIYLEATPALLFNRLKNAKEERPLLKNAPNDEELEKQITGSLLQRKSHYELADLTISAVSIKVKDVLEALPSID